MEKIRFGFWKKVKEHSLADNRSIAVLAPMADVTDAAFRQIITKYGKPDVIWTEFVSADGLCSAGRKVLLRDLAFTEGERPIVAQLFTSHPEKMREAAALVQKLGFDGLDINMGCPDRTIEKQGAGAAMMKDPASAVAVIRAAKEGAPNLPISVKTRIGYNKVEIDTWLPVLLAENIAALTVHARTRKEMSDVPARWEFVKQAVEIRDQIQADLPASDRTLIFGNGDITDLADANNKATATGADGVMLGRAIFGNPWLFSGKNNSSGGNISIKERLNVLVEHTYLFDKLLGDIKNFAIMKKHYKAYVNGWDGAKELRMKLMETQSPVEVERIIKEYLGE